MPRFTPSVGGRVAAPGPGDFPQASPADFGAAIGQGLAGLGEAGQQILANKRRRSDADERLSAGTDIANAQTGYFGQLEELRNTAENGEGYREEALKAYDEMSTSLMQSFTGSEQQKEFARNKLANDKLTIAQNLFADAAKINVGLRVNKTGQQIDAGFNAVLSDPFLFDSTLSSFRDTIDDLELPPDMRLKLLEDGEASFSEAQVLGISRLSPELARQRLASEEIGGLLSKERRVALELGIDSAEVAQAKQLAADAEQAQKGAIRGITQEILAIPDAEEGPVDIDGLRDRIVRSEHLPSTGDGSMPQMLRLLESVTDDITDKHDTARFATLMAGALDGSVEDPSELLGDLSRGTIAIGDYNLLTSVIEEPQDEAVKQFLAGSKALVTGSTSTFADPLGDFQFYKFTLDLFKRIDDGKKNGKKASELLDVTSPSYIGGSLISTYKRNLRDKITTLSSDIRGETIIQGESVQRLDGETKEDYLTRRKASGADGDD